MSKTAKIVIIAIFCAAVMAVLGRAIFFPLNGAVITVLF